MYFFHTEFWPRIFLGLLNIAPPPLPPHPDDPASRLHILCKWRDNISLCYKGSAGPGGGGVIYFKNNEAPHFSISERMYRCINLCLDDARVQ